MSAFDEAIAVAPAAKWNPRDAVIITRGGDPDRRIIYVNRAFCALTAYTADEVIGEDGDLLLSDGSLQMHSPKWLHTDSNGHDVHWIAKLRRKDGRSFWAEARLTPVYAAEGKTTHFIIVLRDVTQREMSVQRTAAVG